MDALTPFSRVLPIPSLFSEQFHEACWKTSDMNLPARAVKQQFPKTSASHTRNYTEPGQKDLIDQACKFNIQAHWMYSKMNSTSHVATCRTRKFLITSCGAMETKTYFKQMPRWFGFSLISSETMISVSLQLRSKPCLKTSDNKNILRVQALISHLPFSSHIYYPAPTHSFHKCRLVTPCSGWLSQDFQMWMQYII